MTERARSSAVSAFVGVATALVIVGVAIVPFLTPAWVLTGQRLTEAEAWSGYTVAELDRIDQALLADLVIGPPDFDVAIAGQPVLQERERQHLRDVRGVFVGLYVLVAIAAAGLLVTARLMADRRRLWRMVRRASLVLIGLVVVGGAITAVAFDAAFEIFHRLFFPAGTYAFDPRTERLVQIFPFAFWTLSTIAVGATVVVLAGLVAWRLKRLSGPAVADPAAADPAAGPVAPRGAAAGRETAAREATS